MTGPKLKRREFLYTLTAGATAPLIAGCTLPKNVAFYRGYEGHKWWLEGAHAPVQQEVVASNLKVQGQLPKDLNGLYVRNGSNYRNLDAPHYFVGDGMLHGVYLEDGEAKWYRNRWVETPLLDNERTPGLNKADNMSNTSIIYYGGRLLSLMELGFPYEINPDLSTKGVYRFDGSLKTAVTAHPKIHPTTGNLHFFGMSFFANPYLKYRVADVDGNIIKRVNVNLPASSMQHDFQVTENYAIFLDLPVIFSMAKAINGEFPYEWKGSRYNSRIGILPHASNGGDVTWFEIETCFSFHTLNAFEDIDGTIILQLARLKRIFVTSPYDINESPMLYEYRIHPKLGIVTERQLGDRSVEFGTVNRDFAGRGHGYSYFLSVHKTGKELTAPPSFRGLVKYGQRGNLMGDYPYRPHQEVSEFSFQPAAESKAEDDGYLMGYMYDKREDQSYLDVFHGQDISSGPVARVELNHKVPSGFHGTFVPKT